MTSLQHTPPNVLMSINNPHPPPHPPPPPCTHRTLAMTHPAPPHVCMPHMLLSLSTMTQQTWCHCCACVTHARVASAVGPAASAFTMRSFAALHTLRACLPGHTGTLTARARCGVQTGRQHAFFSVLLHVVCGENAAAQYACCSLLV